MAARGRFVILSLPRTGSTYLVDYLDALPSIRCLSEVFNPKGVLLRHHESVDPALTDTAKRDRDPIGFLRRLEREIGARDWFGIKFFPGHSERLLRYFCASRRWKKIFLWRENLLEQYISYLLSAAQYGRQTWERVADDARLEVPTATLIDDLHAIEKRYIDIESALILATPEDVFTLEYSDLGRAEPMQSLRSFFKIAARTGAPASLSAPPTFAPGPRAAERIINYGDVLAVLRHSRYGRWLGDARRPL